MNLLTFVILNVFLGAPNLLVPKDEKKCSEKQENCSIVTCNSTGFQCDKMKDCPDGSDEDDCRAGEEPKNDTGDSTATSTGEANRKDAEASTASSEAGNTLWQDAATSDRPVDASQADTQAAGQSADPSTASATDASTHARPKAESSQTGSLVDGSPTVANQTTDSQLSKPSEEAASPKVSNSSTELARSNGPDNPKDTATSRVRSRWS